MSDDDDLPDVGPPLTRREYVVQEAQHLLRLKVWPEEVAKQLDYSDANSLQAALHKWGEHDLAQRFERWHYDGNVPAKIIASQMSRKGIAA